MRRIALLALVLTAGAFALPAGAPAPEPVSAPLAATFASFTPPCRAPDVEARVAPGHVALRWEPVGCAAGYRVLRAVSGESFASIGEVAHAGHVDVAVTPGATYFYALQAIEGDEFYGPIGPTTVVAT